jgi:hypothetical protein
VRSHAIVALTASTKTVDRQRSFDQVKHMAANGDEQASAVLEAVKGLVLDHPWFQFRGVCDCLQFYSKYFLEQSQTLVFTFLLRPKQSKRSLMSSRDWRIRMIHMLSCEFAL